MRCPKRRALWALALVTTWCSVPFGAQACELVLTEHRSGILLTRLPLNSNLPSADIAFTHSVLGTPVLDRYVWKSSSQGWRAHLIEERRRLMHDAETLTAEANSLAELREPGDVQFDEESGEGDTLAVERERDLALSAQFLDQVDEIDRAMLKIGQGTYGICEISGLAIPKERLRAIPWCRERVEYKVGNFRR